MSGYIIEINNETYTIEDISVGYSSIGFDVYNKTEVDLLLAQKEDIFSKNSAFNKNFGTTTGTVCQGDDSRLSDTRAPISHDLAGSFHSAATLAQLNAKISDATLIDTNDSRLSDSRTPISHTHGQIGSDGILTTNVTIATGDRMVITDASNSSIVKGGVAFGTTTTTYLNNSGAFSTPPDTTYTEISTAEIDAGTASDLRTMTGRRSKYMIDKCAPVSHTHTGYALVTTSTSVPSSAPTMIGAIYINTTLNRFYIAVGTASTSDWRGVLTQ